MTRAPSVRAFTCACPAGSPSGPGRRAGALAVSPPALQAKGIREATLAPDRGLYVRALTCRSTRGGHHKLDRRRFVSTLAGFMAFGAGRWTSATAATTGGVSLEGPLTREVFLALLKEPFSLWLDHRAADLVLLRIDDDGDRPASEQFTVVFQTPRELPLLDGTYRISHVTAGTTQVFLQPAGHDDRSGYRKASFNLLRTGAGVHARR